MVEGKIKIPAGGRHMHLGRVGAALAVGWIGACGGKVVGGYAAKGGTAGTGGLTGSGGLGGMTGQSKLGAKCKADADCGGGLSCLTGKSTAEVLGGGPAGGLCTADCTANEDACKSLASGALCVDVAIHPGAAHKAYCVEACEAGPPIEEGFFGKFDPKKCHGRQDVACEELVAGLACMPNRTRSPRTPGKSFPGRGRAALANDAAAPQPGAPP
jgi:hypothetical protein